MTDEIEVEQPRPEDNPNYCIRCEAKRIGAEVPEECIKGQDCLMY